VKTLAGPTAHPHAELSDPPEGASVRVDAAFDIRLCCRTLKHEHADFQIVRRSLLR
jgi:hypothetical protein